MKIVKPTVKTINEFYSEIDDYVLVYANETRKIELAGRTCYNSFDKIDRFDSDTKFCQNMIKSGHEAMVEFAHAILSVDSEVYDELRYANFKFLNMTERNDNYLISGNIRAWRDFVKTADCSSVLKEYILFKFINNEEYNPLFVDIPWNDEINISDVSYNIKFETDYDLCEDERLKHVYYHFVIEGSRSFLAQITRHRLFSFAVRSQRYVRETGNIEFIEPTWYNKKQKNIIGRIKHSYMKYCFRKSCRQSESNYKIMLKIGKAEEARSVLPNATKTIINVSGNLDQFLWFIELRTKKSAQGEIRNIANKIQRIIKFEENFK